MGVAGCYVHAGHSYYSRGVQQIKEVALQERNAVVAFKKMFASFSLEACIHTLQAGRARSVMPQCRCRVHAHVLVPR